MKIIQFSLAYAPFWEFGGPPRVMFSYAKELEKFRINIQVIAVNNDQNKIDYFIKNEHKESSIKITYIRKYDIKLLSRIYFNFSFSQTIKTLSIHTKTTDQVVIIHLAQSRGLFNLIALIFSLFKKTPIALSPFGSLPNRGLIYLKMYDFFFTIPLVKRAALNFAQTQHELSVLKSFGANEKSLFLIPLATEKNISPCLDRRLKTRIALSLENDDLLFMFLGRLHKTKGISNLLNSFSMAYDKNSSRKIKLLIVGNDNGELEHIQKKIATKKMDNLVKMLPAVYDEKRFELYEAADFFVITPIIYEETSLASIEALSMGTPVLTNARAEVPYIEEYNAGFVEKENLDDISQKLIKIINMSDKELLDMRKNALKLFINEFEVTSVSKKLMEALTSIKTRTQL